MENLALHPDIIKNVRQGLLEHNKSHPNASARVSRILLQASPPDADSGEITEKGYINQSRVLSRRADQVDRLYADPPGNDVIVL